MDKTPKKDYKFIGMILPGGIPGNTPREVIFSVCFNINKYCSDFETENANGTPMDVNSIQTNYDKFYKALKELRYFFNSPEKVKFKINSAVPKKITHSSNPFEFYNNTEEPLNDDEYKQIKKDLWNQIFPSKQLRNSSRINKVNIGSPALLIPPNSAEVKLMNSSVDANEFRNLILSADFNEQDIALNKKLSAINEFGKQNETLAKVEKIKFLTDISKKMGGENDKSVNDNYKKAMSFFSDKKEIDSEVFNKNISDIDILLNISDKITDAYIAGESIDIDEVINNFNAISNEPVLLRLMGLVKDFKITLNDNFDIEKNSSFFIEINNESDDIKFMPTPVVFTKYVINSSNKYAFLIKHADTSHFADSILKSKGSSLISYDQVAKVQQNLEAAKKVKNGQDVADGGNKESLTRGILFTNEKIDEIIKPVDIVQRDDQGNILTDKDGNEMFIEKESLTDEHFTRGHRVAAKINGGNLYSLTSRNVELRLKEQKNLIYHFGTFEGCIHFDAPVAYMQDGEVQSTTSNVLFEYSGELLKLKSAFSKANKVDKATQTLNNHEYHHDSGLFKSQARFKDNISFYYFPKLEIPQDDNTYLSCLYGIPENFNKDFAPRLRFGQKYTFTVYQEYLNGWGLPIAPPKKSLQVSLEEITSQAESNYFPIPILFRPLENKKQLQLYHRKKVYDDLTMPIAERASLDHLIVRSDDGEDSRQIVEERHILPPKIDLEPAFWYGLLSEPLMDSKESFLVKRRANCPFLDKDDYDAVDSKGNHKKCPEDCSVYCGGTQMKDHYPEKHIHPNFLTDPTINGFCFKLFWDKDFNKPLSSSENIMKYDGTLGLKPQSVLLRALGASKETFVNDNNGKEVIEVCVKKGAQVYAQLCNEIIESSDNTKNKNVLLNGWWMDVPELRSKHNFLNKITSSLKSEVDEANKCIDDRNQPKQIILTHAVKEPLIIPQIISLSSTPNDHKLIEHIGDWLKKKDFLVYKLDKNIVAERIDKDSLQPLINSSFTRIELTSHFERLDAIKKIEFLKDIIPTGALQIWMRKEEFIDDPNQIVLSTKSVTNHLPYEAVVPFSSSQNIFNLEYKIEFSIAIMNQLKNLKNVVDINTINDAFRSLTTSLVLAYDFKTTKFEEREYYLKNISKFKGFFSDQKLLDTTNSSALQQLEEYALPKLNAVMKNLDKDSDLRFKIIVLNNKQPGKPDVAYAVTTVQENRKQPERRKTVPIQKGNIVTIYLKRGRLTSGKDERVGVIIDADSLYNKIFKDNDLISKAGRDIVSDKFSNRSQYLQYGDIIIPQQNDFKAEYDNELGIYHYLPQFDIEKQLWKFEVELNIITIDGHQLHNPFINFSIFHYQPFSINYNDKNNPSLLELKNDCRLSDIESSTWCYLLPERKLSVFFDKPNWLFDKWGNVDLTISFDYESLHHFNYFDDKTNEDKWKVRSNFILTVQGSHDKLIWYPVNSLVDNNDPKPKWGFHHSLITSELIRKREDNKAQIIASKKLKFEKWSNPDEDGNELPKTNNSTKYSHFRVRFVEVEWFNENTIEDFEKENSSLLATDILDNEGMRIRYVELIY
ncbi:MAG: hypothetical protein M3Z26_09305 [Bacteroidota bacterium]|nr:hypothetical protein [Bacteroidota bacterium]